MPARNETLIWLEVCDPPNVRITYGHYPWQNKTQIGRRVDRLCQKYARGWHCKYCGDLMPVWKRTDAEYCKESCRKLAARKRRVARGAARNGSLDSLDFG